MHLPKASMLACELGGLGRALGIGMDLRQRKVAEDEPKLLAEMLLYGLDDGIGGPTRGTFVVAIFDQRNRGVRITLDVVGCTHRNL